jgi:hypothetical protein
LFLTDLKQYGGERVLYLQKEKLREISVSLKNPFWSDVLLCLSEAKPHTDSHFKNLSVGFWTILSIRLLYINLAFLLDTIFFTKVSVVSK